MIENKDNYPAKEQPEGELTMHEIILKVYKLLSELVKNYLGITE